MSADMKSVISRSLKNMVRHGNIDKITVKALIDDCHISRQTFYYHFQDIMDVMEWSMRQETERLTDKSLKAGTLRDALKIFISFTAEQFPILQKLMNSQRRSQFEKLILDSLETYLGSLAQYQKDHLSVTYPDREVLLRYSACGLAGILLKYGGDPDLDQDRLAVQLERILRGETSEWTKL